LAPRAQGPEGEGKPRLRLLETARLSLTLLSLDLPWGTEAQEPGSVSLRARGETLTFARDGIPGEAWIQGLDATSDIVLRPGGAFVAEAAATLAFAGDGSAVAFSVATFLPDPTAPMDAPPPPLRLRLLGDNLPIPALDILLGTDGLLEALVGPRGAVDLAVDLPADSPGRLDLELAGAVSTVSAHGPVGSALTLDSDALATLEITPALGARILGLVNPLLMNALSGDEPVLATVEATTLSLPLRPFAVADARADIVVEIGEVVIGNGGLVEIILKALGQRQPGRSVASFTPARISLRDGMLTYYPVTMTMGSFQVTLQGVVDLATREVVATLSLPKSSLAPALGDLADLLEDDYVLVVPVGGTVDSPEVDKGVIGDVLGDLLARLAIRALVGGLFGG
ncbi:hypothetical protein IIA16_04460, partial [bacterium]|nr:hypothetical protein [bacterium]